MTAPPWRVEEFLPEYRNWRKRYHPSRTWRDLVLGRIVDLENSGITEYASFLSRETDGYEAIEPILGTTVTIYCLVFERQGRIVIVDIRS